MSATTSTLPFFSTIMAGVSHVAASIYHDVAAIESDVTQWETSNPLLATIATEGEVYLKTFLVQFGVPVDAIVATGQDILAVCKGLAAADASMATVTPKGA
jgi:hypothetical protein